jgi:hypothetical protein
MISRCADQGQRDPESGGFRSAPPTLKPYDFAVMQKKIATLLAQHP